MLVCIHNQMQKGIDTRAHFADTKTRRPRRQFLNQCQPGHLLSIILLGVKREGAYEPGFINSGFQIVSFGNILVK